MEMLIENNTIHEMLKKALMRWMQQITYRCDGEYSRLHNKIHTKKEEPLIKYLQR